jgi:hemerythrin superfamily protein
MNATTLLKRDHRKVKQLFDLYRSATDGKRELIERITADLSTHMAAEEKQLYPVLRTSIPDGQRLVAKSETEHREAKGLLAELQNAEASFDTDAKMATLRRAVDYHVQEEEEEIFPQIKQSLGRARIEQLGTELSRAKRAAPRRAPASAAKNSPGSSVTGVLTAATDRVANLLTSSGRKPPRQSPRRRPSRNRVSRRKKASTQRTKPEQLNRAARRSARKVSGKAQATDTARSERDSLWTW